MGDIKEGQLAKIIFEADYKSAFIDCTIKDVYSDRMSLDVSDEIIDNAKYLQEGAEIAVKVFTQSGIRIFNSIVLNSPEEPEFIIEYVENSIQLQRRNFSRVAFECPLLIKRITDRDIKAKTIDISGGSIRFVTEEELSFDKKLEVYFYLPEGHKAVSFVGHLVGLEHLPQNEYVIVFDEISETDRNKIIKKCFEIETSMYKKE